MDEITSHIGEFTSNLVCLIVMFVWVRVVLRNFALLARKLAGSQWLIVFNLMCLAYNCIQGAMASNLGDPAAAAALNRLLKNIQFHIPDIIIDQDGFHMELTEFVCGSIKLDDLILEGNVTSTHDFVDLEVLGIGIDCKGHYKLHYKLLFLRGDIEAASTNSDIKALVDFGFNEKTVPISSMMSDDNCKTEIKFDTLSFSGSVTAWIIELITPIIKPIMNAEVSKLLCPVMEPLVNTNLTQILSKLSTFVDPFVPGAALTPAPEITTNPRKKLNYTDIYDPILKLVDKIFAADASNNKLMIDDIVDMIVMDGSIVVEPDYTIHIGDDGLTTTNITIFNVSLAGLDTISDPEILYDVHDRFPDYNAAYSLGIDLTIDQIWLNSIGNVSLSPGKYVTSDGPITVSCGADIFLRDLYVNLVIQIPIINAMVDHMNVGSLVEHPLFCLLDMFDLDDIDVSLIDISVGEIDMDTTGFAGVAPLFNEVIDTVLGLYGPTISGLVEGLGDGLIRDKVNSALDILPWVGKLCTPYELPESDVEIASSLLNNFFEKDENDVKTQVASYLENVQTPRANSKYVNFSDSNFWYLIDYIVDDLIGIKSPIYYNIDQLIDTFVNVGYWNKSNILDTTLNLDLDGLSKVVIQVNEVAVAGLDSFDTFNILDPVSDYVLHSDVNIKNLDLLVDTYLGIEGSGINSGHGMYTHLNVKVHLENLQLHTDTKVLMPQEKLYNTTLMDLFGCFKYYFDEIEFYNLSLGLDSVLIDLTCVDDECSSGWAELGDLWRENPDALNHAVQKALDYLFDPNDGTFLRGLNEKLSENIGQECAEATSEGNDDDTEFYVIIGCVVGGGIMVFGLMYYFRQCYGRQKYGKSGGFMNVPSVLSSHSQVQEHSHPMLLPVSEDGRPEPKYWKKENILMFSPLVSPYLRWFIVFFLIFNSAVFLVANFTVGASIGLRMELGGDEFCLLGLYNFSLKNSVESMWEAGVYPLSILIAFMSGLWPHIKIAMMMMCWAFPFPQNDRGLCLLWLDALGKWSLIDMYVLVLCMAAFSFHIQAHDTNYFPSEFAIINIVTTPQVSIFAFIIGAVSSLISTHVIIHYHRRELDRILMGGRDKKTNDKEALRAHAFHCWLNTETDEGREVKITNFGVLSILLLMVSAGFVFALGSFAESFAFHFKGLIAYVIPPDPAYSLLSVSHEVLSSNQYSVGAYVVYVSYILFAFVIPLVALVILLVLFLVPLTLKAQKAFFVAVEVCFAWCSTEVFLVGVIAAMLEINQFAQFLVGGACDQINLLLPLFLPEEAIDSCFSVGTGFYKGCYMLWSGIIVWILVMQAIVRLAERSLKDRRGLTEMIWATKTDEEYCCSDSVGFRLLSQLKLITIGFHRTVSVGTFMTDPITIQKMSVGTFMTDPLTIQKSPNLSHVTGSLAQSLPQEL